MLEVAHPSSEETCWFPAGGAFDKVSGGICELDVAWGREAAVPAVSGVGTIETAESGLITSCGATAEVENTAISLGRGETVT